MAKKDDKTTDKTLFNWYERYTNAIEKLPNELSVMAFEHALIQYAIYGTEPKFMDMKDCPAWMLEALFEACRVSIQNSVEVCERNRKAAAASVEARRAKKETADACAKMAAVNTKKEKADKTWQAADCYDGPELTSSIPEYNVPYDESTCPF